ncbi:MAG: ribosomal protein S18-alanine N-acetyltransferase [Gemmatimonadetes bacterium]|nr:ribosomal protein S18-alanine N-acetyltransferase [Gemmatimonadota bacterium]MBI3566625.1 ribosomal protein S18-alanine N-acetyltransferase [Gemmatimonadota bacterium]
MTGLGTARFRSAEARDLEAVHALEVASFSDPWPLAGFRELLDQSHVDFDVAESETGELLGYLVALRAADEAEVANLAVHANARRGGIGRALLDAFLARAPAAGVRAVYLEVRESNLAARALYASRGFVQAGRRRQYYRKPVEDALILRRAL